MNLKMSLLLLLCLYGRGILAASNTLALIRISLEETGSQGTDHADASNTDRVIQALASSDATQLASLVQDQQGMIQNLLELVRNVSERVGTNYIRWGRKTCPSTATIAYQGYTAKSDHTHRGGGVDHQCLSMTPERPLGATAGAQHLSYIKGSEYRQHSTTVLNQNLLHHDVPCVRCVVKGRGQIMMIPGKKTCLQDWTLEYSGVLMSAHYLHTKSTYLCVDKDPETDNAGAANLQGDLLYLVEASCGSLPCPPYEEGEELSCAVCTY